MKKRIADGDTHELKQIVSRMETGDAVYDSVIQRAVDLRNNGGVLDEEERQDYLNRLLKAIDQSRGTVWGSRKGPILASAIALFGDKSAETDQIRQLVLEDNDSNS